MHSYGALAEMNLDVDAALDLSYNVINDGAMALGEAARGRTQ